MNRFALASVVAVLAVLPVGADDLPISRRWQSSTSRETSRQTVVIKEQADWEVTWAKTTGRVMTSRELPKIDFENEMVVAIFLGKRSGGSVRITRVAKEGNEVQVFYREQLPERASDKTTYPFHMAVVPLATGAVTFHVDK